MPTPSPKTIIGIPGSWPTRRDIVTSIAKDSGGYLFAGMIMMHMDSKAVFQVDVADHDDHLSNAFGIAGCNRISPEEWKPITEHTFCVYLIAEGGSVEAARRFIDAGQALLKCGGLGIKIESAGLAHSSAKWNQFAADPSPGNLMEAFVTYVGSGGHFYSCGMHNLGFPDAIIEAPIPPAEAAHLLHTFLSYLLVENPILSSGHTFSVDAASPRYRLLQEECARFPSDDPFHNPYGIWKLIPV